MAKIREGDTVLLRGEVTRADDEDGTITVLLDGIVPIRHTVRADSNTIDASGGNPTPEVDQREPVGTRLWVFACRVMPIFPAAAL